MCEGGQRSGTDEWRALPSVLPQPYHCACLAFWPVAHCLGPAFSMSKRISWALSSVRDCDV